MIPKCKGFSAPSKFWEKYNFDGAEKCGVLQIRMWEPPTLSQAPANLRVADVIW
jgi:hypothetical protein